MEIHFKSGKKLDITEKTMQQIANNLNANPQVLWMQFWDDKEKVTHIIHMTEVEYIL